MIVSQTLGTKIQEVDPPQGAVELEKKDSNVLSQAPPIDDLFASKMAHMEMRQMMKMKQMKGKKMMKW